MTKSLRFPATTNAQRRRRYHAAIRDAFPNDETLSYFIKEEDSDHVKIGMVNDKWAIEQRLSTLQTSTPHPLVLIGISNMREKDLHKQFAHLRVRGEWFHYTKEIKDFLENKFPVPEWLKLMKCPSCKKNSTFRQEEVCTMKWGSAYPLAITGDGQIYVDRDQQKRLNFPSENEPLDPDKCLCDTCDALVNIRDIELVDS